MKHVTLAKLIEVLSAHPGTAIVTMVTRTEPRLLARSRSDRTQKACDRWPHGIEKLCLGRFMLRNNYQANVRAQRRREGHPRPEAFTRDKLWAGKGRRIGNYVAEHKESGRLYLVARPQTDAGGNPVRLWERWIDLATGQDLDAIQRAELVRDWLHDRPAQNTKQQVSRPIPYRTYHVVSVHTLQINGETWRIDPDVPAYRVA
jgi:hypothetical protein